MPYDYSHCWRDIDEVVTDDWFHNPRTFNGCHQINHNRHPDNRLPAAGGLAASTSRLRAHLTSVIQSLCQLTRQDEAYEQRGSKKWYKL